PADDRVQYELRGRHRFLLQCGKRPRRGRGGRRGLSLPVTGQRLASAARATERTKLTESPFAARVRASDDPPSRASAIAGLRRTIGSLSLASRLSSVVRAPATRNCATVAVATRRTDTSESPRSGTSSLPVRSPFSAS